MSKITFEPVWYARTQPRPNFTPSRYFATGALTVEGRTVEFHSREPPVRSSTLLRGGVPVDIRIDEVLSVGVER